MNLSRDPASNPDSEKGLPVSIAASHLDGLVLALTPNSHSYNYRSAVLFGHAQLVTELDEKLYAMQLVTDGVVPGRWNGSRVPPNAAEMSSTSVLRVRIATGSAKIRSGPPGDDRGDLEDTALLGRVWTGVVPVYTTLGEPIPGPYNKVAAPPAYLEEYRTETNADVKGYAVEAALKDLHAAKKVASEEEEH
ncbi:hypothetical protein B0H63DRAFT_476015 [Podospora didyma]|uniref:Flavin-nucleotide-binding protein n=1 Tax=Podospora didyma TaxID=330526 RepID=A0AAE0TW08_9PEZI|nr:hypothetical protein B0H63DRAFT_476015 [Podospora didyma]